LDYLRLTGRDESRVRLVEEYARAQGLFRTIEGQDPIYSETIELDLESIEPSLAGPKRPQDRVSLRKAKTAFQAGLPTMPGPAKPVVGAGDVGGNRQGAAAARAVAQAGRAVSAPALPDLDHSRVA